MRSALVLLIVLAATGCGGEDEVKEPPIDLGTPLLAAGTVGDWCAPDNSPALAFVFGTAATCDMPPGTDPQVHFVVYPASSSTITAGQKWSFDEQTLGMEARAWWYAEGVNGMAETPKSGFVEIRQVSIVDVVARYSFVTKDDSKYGGEVKIYLCPIDPMCG